MLIGLSGLPFNGKGTVAKRLAEAHGFRHTKMAGALKNMLRVMLREAGVDDEMIERMIEGDLKETPQPMLGNRTPRWAMQSLGTEWGRDCITPTLWGDIWQLGVIRQLEAGKSVVVDYVRFADEQARVKRLGGFIVLVAGRSEAASGHASDKMDWLEPDYTILNDGSLRDLDLKVDNLLKRMQKDVWDE